MYCEDRGTPILMIRIETLRDIIGLPINHVDSISKKNAHRRHYLSRLFGITAVSFSLLHVKDA